MRCAAVPFLSHSVESNIFFFFFSSRRRHTRCYRDWSSDVCSSDLRPARSYLVAVLSELGRQQEAVNEMVKVRTTGGRPDRSEERRVGKECRCRWAPDD